MNECTIERDSNFITVGMQSTFKSMSASSITENV